MKNYQMVLAYEGTKYNGWQKQGNTENTIQGKLETLLSRRFAQEVEVNGSGRTDAGVHALGQVASMRLDTTLTEDELQHEINLFLPKDIRCLSIKEADPRFHARLSAKQKTYRYTITTGEYVDVFMRNTQYQMEEWLDVNCMQKAANALLGTHDFASFCAMKRMKKSTVRTIYDIDIVETKQNGGQQIDLTFIGDGFLYHMVRLIVGELIAVGLGHQNPDALQELLEQKRLAAAKHLAPAKGLTLVEVGYEV